MDRKVKHWQDLYLNWLTFGTNTTVVHYENIRENPEKSVKQILSFLSVDLDPQRLKCLLENPAGHFLRKGSTRKSKATHRFSQKQKDKIFAAIQSVNRSLTLAGKAPIPFHLYEF